MVLHLCEPFPTYRKFVSPHTTYSGAITRPKHTIGYVFPTSKFEN